MNKLFQHKIFYAIFLVTMTLKAYSGIIIENGNLKINGIVIPDKPNSVEKFAARELAYFLQKSTKAKNTVSTINEKNIVAGKNYIFLGRCKKNKAMGIDVEKLERNHSRVLIDGQNIYIAGKDSDGYFWRETTALGTAFGVYEILEKYFRIKWIWPGELGEIIPEISNLSIPDRLYKFSPKLSGSRWRNSREVLHGWKNKKNRKKFLGEQAVWRIRHRFSWNLEFAHGHAFENYYRKYSKSNPEYFNLLPDGTRSSNPYGWHHGGARYISLCVTNPDLHKKIVENWKNESPRKLTLNLNENDTLGCCVCENCLNADNSKIPNKKRLAGAKKLFKLKDSLWVDKLGSLSDRYAKFYLAVQKEADKIDPKHRINGLVYVNYSEPPSDKIKLNDRITLRFCPPIMYPLTAKKINDFKRIWLGWSKAGARLMFRPNFTLDGGGFTVNFQNEFYEIFSFGAKNGMIASDMDSLIGQFAAQAPLNYVIASLNHSNKPLREMEDEFYSAFGTAKDAIKEYFDYQRKISMRSGVEKLFNERFPEGGGGGWLTMFLVADAIYTPEVMKKSNGLIAKALNSPKLDEISRRRVKFVQSALINMQLMIDAQKEFRKYKNKQENKFYEKVKTLYDYRASIEDSNAINMGFLRYLEERHWPRFEALHLQKSGAVRLTNWKLLIDEKNIGNKQKWFSTKFDFSKGIPVNTKTHWAKQQPGIEWKKKHNKNYHGITWYFNKLDNIDVDKISKKTFSFQAVDGSANIYLNGEKIHYRAYPFEEDSNSWRYPFDVKIPDNLLRKSNNTLVVRVEKHEGLNGIWQPVYLK